VKVKLLKRLLGQIKLIVTSRFALVLCAVHLLLFLISIDHRHEYYSRQWNDLSVVTDTFQYDQFAGHEFYFFSPYDESPILFRVLSQLDLIPFILGIFTCEAIVKTFAIRLTDEAMSWTWALLVIIYGSIQWLLVGYYIGNLIKKWQGVRGSNGI